MISKQCKKEKRSVLDSALFAVRLDSGGPMRSIFAFFPFLLIFLAALLAPGDAGAQELDKESLDCLLCHPESFPAQVCMLMDCDHPVGNDYVVASMRNKGLTPPFALPPPVRLINNRIGCTTCHIPFSEQSHASMTARRRSYPAVPDPMLVMENRHSELCLSCHRK